MRTRRFTLVEILVVIGVIMALLALLMPAYNMVKGRAKMNDCLNNLKQIGLCLHQYAIDSRDTLPVCERFTSTYGLPTIRTVLSPYANDNVKIFQCPADLKNYLTYGTSYEWNSFVNGEKIDKDSFVVGATTVIAPLCGDADSYHQGKKNYLYSDGHISSSYDLLLKTN